MNYVTTGSSNSVLDGDPLKLKIVISKVHLDSILPTDYFTIENLENIIANNDLKYVKCKLSGELKNATTKNSPVSIGELIYNASNKGKRSFKLSQNTNEFAYLILEINKVNCRIAGDFTNLAISFKNKNDEGTPLPLVRIDFTVYAEKVKPEILKFSSNQMVLQHGEPATLSWKIKGKQFILREGIREIERGTGLVEDEYPLGKISNGDHSYTLEVQQGDVSVTKTIPIRVLDESKMYTISAPSDNDVSYTISNFCVSQDYSCLFSLVLKKEDNIGRLDHIRYTYTNDSSSNNWSKIELSETEKEQLKPFAGSPFVHLKSPGEFYGRLLFIGGSYVNATKYNKLVVIIDLDAESGDSRISIINNIPWSSRMGHSCTLFTHGDQDKIWLIGGIDEWGAALNDIWVSGDGKVWENLNPDGTVNPKPKGQNPQIPATMPWEKRGMASVTVELNNDGSKRALLIGGGFSEMGGSETPDIWKWDKKSWEAFKDFKINGSSYLSSALFFLGKDIIDSTGFVLLGGYEREENGETVKRKYFYNLTINNGQYINVALDEASGAGSFATSKNSKIITGFFKGSMWYIVLTNEGAAGITYSNLFYWIPVSNGETLIFT